MFNRHRALLPPASPEEIAERKFSEGEGQTASFLQHPDWYGWPYKVNTEDLIGLKIPLARI